MKIISLEYNKNKDVVNFAEDILERCKKGEIVELNIMAVRPDGTYFTTGTTVKNQMITIGMFMSAILDLNEAGKNEQDMSR